jgi:hypothetical protein
LEVNGEPGKPISEFVVKIRVSNYQAYLGRFDPTTDPPSITIPECPYSGELLQLLQFLEATGSFWLGIQRIRWDEAEYGWEAEDEQERGELQIFSFAQKQPVYERREQRVQPLLLWELLTRRMELNYLVLPMSFFREGMNDFTAHRYVNAYHNFYFFLEDLYGDGKTKNRQVAAAFRRSKQIQAALRQLLADSDGNGLGAHLGAVGEFAKMEGCAMTPDGLIDLIVKVRGNLHHFSQKSTRLKGHPLNQDRFRSMAYLLMGVCLKTSARLLGGGAVA